jgi:hypothetical protein
MNSHQLFNAVKEYLATEQKPQLFCFDYFDTLVTRTVYPEATKKIASKISPIFSEPISHLLLSTISGNSWKSLFVSAIISEGLILNFP